MAGIITVADVTLAPGSPVSPWQVGGHTVYTRAAWGGEWVEQSDLHCEEAVWCAAPSISTATLIWHYGRIAPTGAISFQEVLRRTAHNRIYVKVTFQMKNTAPDEWTTRDWYGVIEVDEDQLLGEVIEGSGNRLAMGEQTFTAYGFEHLLDQQFINRAWWDNAGSIDEIRRAVVFNRDGKKNRSPSESGGTYHFAGDKTEAEWWSSRHIVEYLLRYHSPRNQYDAVAIPFAINYGGMAAAVPAWDHPEVDPTNRSLWSVLTSLIPRQRLSSFYVDVADDEVRLRPFTFVDEDIDTTQDAEAIPANVNQIRILAAQDQSGEVAVKTSTVERYDQVIAQGAWRRNVCTVSHPDETLEAGWTTAQETEYETGASGIGAAYDDASLDEQRRLNHEARSVDKLRNVFSRFAIPLDWDGRVQDGFAGGTYHAVFPDDVNDPPEVFPQYWPDLIIEKTLPLLEGVDYSDDKIPNETVDENGFETELSPLVFWNLPGVSPPRYCNVEKFSRDTPLLDSAEEWNWSAGVTVPDDDRAIRLNVVGAPQHVLDFEGFDGIAGVDEDLGEHDWKDALFTVSFQDDRRAEGIYPHDDDIPAGDYIQRLWIEAGDGFRVDYVTPDTIVGLDEEGNYIRSDGGYLHDDREELEAIAKIAYLFYSRDRRVLALATDQLTDEIEIGDFVTELNQQDSDTAGSHYFAIATPVTEIRINTAWGTTDSPPVAPRMRIVTDSGQLDALAFVSPAPTRIVARKGQIVGADERYQIFIYQDAPPAGSRDVGDEIYQFYWGPPAQ